MSVFPAKGPSKGKMGPSKGRMGEWCLPSIFFLPWFFSSLIFGIEHMVEDSWRSFWTYTKKLPQKFKSNEVKTPCCIVSHDIGCIQVYYQHYNRIGARCRTCAARLLRPGSAENNLSGQHSVFQGKTTLQQHCKKI
jgi:hypothetical protein